MEGATITIAVPSLKQQQPQPQPRPKRRVQLQGQSSLEEIKHYHHHSPPAGAPGQLYPPGMNPSRRRSSHPTPQDSSNLLGADLRLGEGRSLMVGGSTGSGLDAVDDYGGSQQHLNAGLHRSPSTFGELGAQTAQCM